MHWKDISCHVTIPVALYSNMYWPVQPSYTLRLFVKNLHWNFKSNLYDMRLFVLYSVLIGSYQLWISSRTTKKVKSLRYKTRRQGEQISHVWVKAQSKFHKETLKECRSIHFVLAVSPSEYKQGSMETGNTKLCPFYTNRTICILTPNKSICRRRKKHWRSPSSNHVTHVAH
jgi:hypothetical protein